jgi:hypothetical protein
VLLDEGGYIYTTSHVYVIVTGKPRHPYGNI